MTLEMQIAKAAELVIRARIFLDAWELSHGEIGRKKYLHFLDEYWEFWRFNEHALRFTHITETAALFEKNKKTICFHGLIIKLKQKYKADYTTIDRLVAETSKTAIGVAVLRNNAFAHRSATMDFEDAFTKASLSFDNLRALSSSALRLANEMLRVFGAQSLEFAELPLQALKQLASGKILKKRASGTMEVQAMSGSRTIASSESKGDSDRLDNVHPGDILRHDYLIGSEIPVTEVVTGAGVSEARLLAILDADLAVDADTDLRLARYFGVSEGMFLGLQIDYDTEEAKRSLNGSLDRIVPRAA